MAPSMGVLDKEPTMYRYAPEAPSPHPAKPLIDSPSDVAARAADLAARLHECARILLLNKRHWLLGTVDLDEGHRHWVAMHPHDVFRPAIEAGASVLILVHNHPGGNPEPSPQDLETTRRLAAGGELLAIEVLDHVIVVPGGYISLRERGMLPTSASAVVPQDDRPFHPRRYTLLLRDRRRLEVFPWGGHAIPSRTS